ncbi:PstS family phosphate ABC transporter substrate-binding protein [Brenneria rubrifaciens]|uniref:PBP domain-containing protein n=1 Tax=Brenneria rubrifaciens TaxID=55213 RepID=A0A4P8QM44_9GAMM|nr:substrate-binding domain-containing protein [Brenneria rubrifaciens]QCR07958.1 hypothetical protein EH207_05130 [Brenneria rubrifaciens]
MNADFFAGKARPDHGDSAGEISNRLNERFPPDNPFPAGVIRITGAADAATLLEKIIEAFRLFYPNIQVETDLRGEASAFAYLINARATMAIVEREITLAEAVPYKKQVGTAPFALRVAIGSHGTTACPASSLGVYVHRSNPLKKLTLAQLTRIFTLGNPGGDYSRWGQLGLEQHWQAGGIFPLTTAEDSALIGYMQKYHFAGRELHANCEYFPDTDALLARLENHPYGIGIAEIGRETPDLRMLSLAYDGQPAFSSEQPTASVGGAYPLARFLYLYLPLKNPPVADGAALEFSRFILSRQGQKIIADHAERFTPLDEADADKQLALLTVHS